MAMYSSPASRAARAMVLGSARPSVAVVCMCMSPRRSCERDQPRQRAGLGRLDLAAILAQLRWNERQSQRLVDAFLGLPGHQRTIVDPVEPVLVELEAALDGAIAKFDVVALRAGEVLERRAALLRGNQPQVGLKPAPEQDARLGLTVSQHPLDQPVSGERVHQRRRRAGGEDVEVAARLAAAPEAPDHRDRRAGRVLAEPADERGGGVVGFGA